MIGLVAAVLLGTAHQYGAGLDCSAGNEALRAGVERSPEKPSPLPGGNPLFSLHPDEAAKAVYTLTKPAHPAHPAVLMTRLVSEPPGVESSACGYGEKAEFDRLIADWLAKPPAEEWRN